MSAKNKGFDHTLLKDYVRRIQDSPVYVAAKKTDLDPAIYLSERLGHKILLKREDTQPVGSFKLRGALQMMMALDPEKRKNGVVCASAGNHAQGVALAAKMLGVIATIVMPETTPDVKINAVQRHGGEFVNIVKHGTSFPEALEHAEQLAKQNEQTFVHPYDNPDVIAGQGTIGKEILDQHPEQIEAIFVPIGGGGLITGIAAYVKYMRPDIKIIGVESEGSACFKEAMDAGFRRQLERVGLFVDGLAVAQVGKLPFEMRHLVDEVITVSNDEVCAAILDVANETGTYPEPAGAVSVAGMKKYNAKHKNNTNPGAQVCVISGRNMDPRRLGYVIERAEVYNKHEMLLTVTIPETPGSLLDFCKLLGKRNISEFNYRYSRKSGAHIFVGIQMNDYDKEGPALLKQLNDAGYAATDLTNNELARDHIRHMVGGRPMRSFEETVLSFEFPERPRALEDFLTAMNHHSWNMSLCHYRNHGADPARVLIGWEVKAPEREAFLKLVDKTEFSYTNESDNQAYKIFLDHIPKSDAGVAIAPSLPGKKAPGSTLDGLGSGPGK